MNITPADRRTQSSNVRAESSGDSRMSLDFILNAPDPTPDRMVARHSEAGPSNRRPTPRSGGNLAKRRQLPELQIDIGLQDKQVQEIKKLLRKDGGHLSMQQAFTYVTKYNANHRKGWTFESRVEATGISRKHALEAEHRLAAPGEMTSRAKTWIDQNCAAITVASERARMIFRHNVEKNNDGWQTRSMAKACGLTIYAFSSATEVERRQQALNEELIEARDAVAKDLKPLEVFKHLFGINLDRQPDARWSVRDLAYAADLRMAKAYDYAELLSPLTESEKELQRRFTDKGLLRDGKSVYTMREAYDRARSEFPDENTDTIRKLLGITKANRSLFMSRERGKRRGIALPGDDNSVRL